jgi:AcrR family transcriptional regulator
VARVEFARRGYQATTMREIAQAAEISIGTVYRLFRSKDELLESIMGAFVANYLASWQGVLGSSSSAVEKLDALQWVNINLLDGFAEEFKIQLAWLQQSPPESIEIGLAYSQLLRQLQSLLTLAEREGVLRRDGGSMSTRSRSMFELIFTTDHVVRQSGPRAALTLARESVLSGAMTRS